MLTVLFWGALYIKEKFSMLIILFRDFEKSPMISILFWGALYMYEKLSSFTILSCMIKVRKSLNLFIIQIDLK